MNPSKAAGFGILLYLLLSIVSVAVMYVLGLPYTDRVIVFATPLFCIPLAYFYLRDVAEKQFMESVELGFFWAVINIFLDIAVSVSMLGRGWDYFNAPLVWIKYGEFVFFSTIIGALVEETTEKTPFKESKNSMSKW